MMAVDLPTPRLGGRRRAHDTEPVEVFAEFIDPPCHLHHRLVEAHDVAGRGESLVAEALFQEREGALDLLIRHFAKAMPWRMMVR